MNNVSKIFGAPGCGKTTYLLNILEKELKEHEPDKIAFVSFTRKGSYEGRDRAVERFNYRKEELKYFRTLHSIAFMECGFSKYDMISKSDYKTFSNAVGMKFTGYYTQDFFHNDDRYLFLDFLRRNNSEMFMKYLYDIDIRKLKFVAYNYVKYKQFAKVVDFTDIIQAFIDKNISLSIDVAIIDEAQDLTTLQWKMCEVAFRNCKKVYIAGDDDQAIYEWSGADVKRFIHSYQSDTLVLDKSYRLRKKILQFTKRIGENIKDRIQKEFEPVNDGGEICFYNSIEEIEIKQDETYYFLSRNNWFLNTYRNFLKRKAYGFIDKDEYSINPNHIRAITDFERARKAKRNIDPDNLSIKLFLKDKVDMTLPWFNNFDFDNDLIAYYKDLIRCKSDLTNKNLRVNTIHGVKGGEADNVVFILDFTKAVKNNLETNPDSELRCLYVACTRAKKSLHLIHSSSRNGYDDYFNFKEYAK